MLAAKWEVPEQRHMSIQARKWTKAFTEPGQGVYAYAESISYRRQFPSCGETKLVCLRGNRLSPIKPCSAKIMFIFLPASSKQHQVTRALLQWPQNCFSLVKKKRYACRREAEQSVILLVGVSGRAVPILVLKLKQEQKKVQEKTKPKQP